jgi:hypothetical protein
MYFHHNVDKIATKTNIIFSITTFLLYINIIDTYSHFRNRFFCTHKKHISNNLIIIMIYFYRISSLIVIQLYILGCIKKTTSTRRK